METIFVNGRISTLDRQGKARKGRIAKGQFADLCALNADYFAVQDEDIKATESVLAVVGGRIVHATEEFTDLAPPLPPVMPDWSPVRSYRGYQRALALHKHALACGTNGHGHSL